MEWPRFQNLIEDILSKETLAVVGASRDTHKFGFQVYRALKEARYTVYPVNPNVEEIDGDAAYPLLDNLPLRPDCVVTVVPPEVTYQIVRQAGQLTIPAVWMQPGSESDSAVAEAQANGMQVVYGGPCIIVETSKRRRVEDEG